MASTFSPNLRIELIGAGEQSGAWNNTTNTNLGTLIEQAICGVQEITLAGSDYTLEFANGASDESRNMTLILKGTPGASRNIIAPDVDKVYIVRNETADSHTIKTTSGSGVSVPANSSAIVFCDKDAGGGNGTFYNAVEDLAAGATVGGSEITTNTGTQTLTNKTLTAPKFADGGFVADANGNELIVMDTVASAVNEITVANAATGSGPSISSSGSDTNIDILLAPKGTGVVKAGGVEVATLTGTQSLSNKTIASPANVSATTGNAAIIAATGPDTNIDINLTPKGTGSVLINGAGGFLIPTGSVMPFAGTTAPSGWLLSFGQAVSRSTYADLFAIIGTTYGVGDNSTTFNLPDLRGRTAAGKDDMGGSSANRLTGTSGGVDGDILGGTGGLETHTLTEAQMPAHKHGSGGLTKSNIDLGVYGITTTDVPGLASQAADAGFGTSSASSQPFTQTVGGGGAHNNVQPTIILNYIIKT